MEKEVSQATLAFLAAYWRLISVSYGELEDTFNPLFDDVQYSFAWDLVGYTMNFSDIIANSLDTESSSFYPNNINFDASFYMEAISQFSGEEFTLAKFKENPLKWCKINANYFFGLPPKHPMRKYQIYYADCLIGWPIECNYVFYQCYCSIILGSNLAQQDFGAWYNNLRPKTSNENKFRLYDALRSEADLIQDHFLIPVPLSSKEWVKTDNVIKPPADPIKVIVLNKYFVCYFILEMKTSPVMIEQLRLAGIFDI